MKTILSTGPLLYSVRTEHAVPRLGVEAAPPGKVRVMCVRYETYEMDQDDFDQSTFTIHDANRPEAKLLASLQSA